MIRTISVLLVSGLAVSAQARDLSQDIIVETYPDFLAIDLVSETHDVEYVISGPDNYHQRKRNTVDATAYVEMQDQQGVSLADGVYKWEAWATPRETISREESMAMPNRNDLSMTMATRNNRISGSFRVVNGQIVDSGEQELDLKSEVSEVRQ